jgi:hypothetical protein
VEPLVQILFFPQLLLLVVVVEVLAILNKMVEQVVQVAEEAIQAQVVQEQHLQYRDLMVVVIPLLMAQAVAVAVRVLLEQVLHQLKALLVVMVFK